MRKQLRFQASAATDPGLPGQCMLTALTEDYKVLRGHYYKRGQEQCQPNEVADYIWWSASENQPRPGCVLINSPKALHSGTTAAFVYTERKMSCLLSSANKFSGEGLCSMGKAGLSPSRARIQSNTQGGKMFLPEVELEPLCWKVDTVSLSSEPLALL